VLFSTVSGTSRSTDRRYRSGRVQHPTHSARYAGPNTLMPTFFFQSSEQLLTSISGIAFNARSDSRLMSSIDSKPGAVVWVCWTARSHTELNQANTVVVERYLLNFWRKILEESMQCATVHYRDAKTKCYHI